MKQSVDFNAYLDSLPMPSGEMPPREELISGMADRLREEKIDEAEIALFQSCSRTLTDERLFKSFAFFWNTRT